MKNDLISKQEAIDVLNLADDRGEIRSVMDAISTIKALPPVDAVPVVRCKDCKYSEHWYKDKRRCFLWVEDGIDVFNDGFCNYGERKDGDGNG